MIKQEPTTATMESQSAGPRSDMHCPFFVMGATKFMDAN
jgi:hypothetical protein